VTSPVVIVGAVVALTCWVMTLIKLRDLVRDPGNHPLRYLTLTLAALTLSMTVQPLAQWLDQQTGVLDVGRVAANSLVLVGIVAAQSMLMLMTGAGATVRRRIRREWLVMLSAVALILVIFVVTPARYSVSDPYVVSHAYYWQTPTVAAAPYQLVFLSYFTWALWRCSVQVHRYALAARRPLLRVGLRLVRAGCALGFAYIAIKAAAIVVASVTSLSTAPLDRLIVPCYVLAAASILLGATLPSWGPRIGLDRVVGAALALRDCRRLGPLWNLIIDVTPQVTLLPHPREPALRRVRMAVEILDGYALLGPWTSTRTATLAQRTADGSAMSTTDRTAWVEAAVLADAARRKVTEQPPEPDSTVPIPMLHLPPALHDDESTTNAHIAWLSRVSAALRIERGLRIG
jgi:hypothetical protein